VQRIGFLALALAFSRGEEVVVVVVWSTSYYAKKGPKAPAGTNKPTKSTLRM
jgi:hypothetical protein